MPHQISVQNLSKTFLVPHQKRTTLKESFVEFWRPKTYEKFAALSDISFDIKAGEFIGIVGQNGCGKSTLLKILAGISRADSGQVIVNGRIAPFLELGIGFQQDLSARENIFINGTLLGLTTNQIKHLLPKIVEFAEIGHFLDLKVKNFSSGMRQRLAFAIAANLDADIYLCDEVFAVGDENFQKKCLRTFAQWHAQGKTIILVSHNASQIEELCQRVIYLEKGQIKAMGKPKQAIAVYHHDLNPSAQTVHFQSNLDFANSPLRLTDLELFADNLRPTNRFGTGENLHLRIHYHATKIIEQPVFGLAIHKANSQQTAETNHAENHLHISGPNTKTSDFLISTINPGPGYIDCHLTNLNLLSGQYLISLSCFDYTCQNPFDYLDKQFSFTVFPNRVNQYGLVDLSVKWFKP